MPDETEKKQWDREDRDLLISLASSVESFHKTTNEKLIELKSDIRELKDGMTTRVQILERDKADRRDVEALQKKVNEDMEARVNSLEKQSGNYVLMSVIYAGIGSVMCGLILYHIFNK